MKNPFKKIGIIGLGLIGGSLAKTIKGNNLNIKVFGVDINKKALDYGLRYNFIDEGSTSYEVLKEADIIFLAIPVKSYYKVLPLLKDFLKTLDKKPIVSDLGSVKGHLVEFAQDVLSPINVEFIGAHPIAGNEKSGIENAIFNLYKNKLTIITPTEKNKKETIENMIAFWKNLDSHPIIMDPYFHDLVFASVSHLPHLVAYALVDTIKRLSKEEKINLFEFVGAGFKDFTRIAASDPTMWKDIFLENKKNILKVLDVFLKVLNYYKKLIEEDKEKELFDVLNKTASERRKLS